MIVPALNEAARIASVVEGGAGHVDAVYVVDDGSTDATADAARAAGAASGLLLLLAAVRRPHPGLPGDA